VQHREFCNIPNTRNVFEIHGREKSGNLWQIKVELTKHRESSPRKIRGPVFQCFMLIISLWNRGIIVLSHCQITNHFMFAQGKFKFFLMVPWGILKMFLVHGALSTRNVQWYHLEGYCEPMSEGEVGIFSLVGKHLLGQTNFRFDIGSKRDF
jgi:hypothetical protein